MACDIHIITVDLVSVANPVVFMLFHDYFMLIVSTTLKVLFDLPVVLHVSLLCRIWNVFFKDFLNKKYRVGSRL